MTCTKADAARLSGRRKKAHPIMAAPRKHVATRTKDTAVPWPEFALRAMPSATVEIKTIRHPGQTLRRTGVRTLRASRQRGPRGMATRSTVSPATLIPWEWTTRPIPTKTRTATASAATLAERIRRKANASRPDPAAACSGQLSARGVGRRGIGSFDLAIGELFRLTLWASPQRRANRQLLVCLRCQLRALR